MKSFLIKDFIFKKKMYQNSFSNYLVKGVVGSLAIQAITILLTFFSNFIVAKLFGASEYGTFTYLFTCITVVANIVLLGFNTLFIREVAIYKSKQEWSRLKGIIIVATFSVIGASGVAAFLVVLLFKSINSLSRIGDIHLLELSLVALPMMALIMLYQSLLLGLQKILPGQLPEKIVRPSVFVCLVIILSVYKSLEIDVSHLIVLNIIAFAVALIWVVRSLIKNIFSLIQHVNPNYETKKWIKSTSYFFILGIVQIINSRVDVLLLGGWKSSRDVGVYNIAVRLSDFVAMSLFIINTVIAPSISRLYHSRQKEKLQRLVTSSARANLFLSLPVVLLLIFAGRFILSFFGAEFSAGYVPMLIIVLAQVFNAFCGSVGYLLIMTGNEKYAFISLLISAFVNVSLNIFLIPQWGMIGTAIAVATSIVVWNGLMLFFVRRKTNIFPTALGNF
jgi:O-antigen/teichoic acid export membrane protein